MLIKYSNIAGDTLQPVRANPSDAGLDIFYNGPDCEIAPSENRIMATGIRMEIPHGYMIQVCNRGSMGATRSLIVGAHIIDSGYSGEIFIDLHNVGTENQHLKFGSKIAQLVMVPIVSFRLIQVEENELYSDCITISNREQGSLGSTGA
jgi:dUTP pyrophosphatase